MTTAYDEAVEKELRRQESLGGRDYGAYVNQALTIFDEKPNEAQALLEKDADFLKRSLSTIEEKNEFFDQFAQEVVRNPDGQTLYSLLREEVLEGADAGGEDQSAEVSKEPEAETGLRKWVGEREAQFLVADGDGAAAEQKKLRFEDEGGKVGPWF